MQGPPVLERSGGLENGRRSILVVLPPKRKLAMYLEFKDHFAFLLPWVFSVRKGLILNLE